MSRPLRVEFNDALYHIISRGERKENIFLSDSDRFKFLEKLEESVEKFNILVHVYVLMENHYHLLIETPQGNLIKMMHHLNTSYSNWFKGKNKVIGSVFQGRYKSILVDKDSYLKVLSAYIHLNPWRAKIVKKAEDYKWSSFRFYVKNIKSPEWLYLTDILSEFSNNISNYYEFVEGWKDLENKIEKKEIYGKNSILGDQIFERKVMSRIKRSIKSIKERELPDLRSLSKRSVDDIKSVILDEFKIKESDLFRKQKGNFWRKLFVFGLRKYTALSLNEIGDLLQMDYGAVSQMNKRFLKEVEENNKINKLVAQFDIKLKKRKELNVEY